MHTRRWIRGWDSLLLTDTHFHEIVTGHRSYHCHHSLTGWSQAPDSPELGSDSSLTVAAEAACLSVAEPALHLDTALHHPSALHHQDSLHPWHPGTVCHLPSGHRRSDRTGCHRHLCCLPHLTYQGHCHSSRRHMHQHHLHRHPAVRLDHRRQQALHCSHIPACWLAAVALASVLALDHSHWALTRKRIAHTSLGSADLLGVAHHDSAHPSKSIRPQKSCLIALTLKRHGPWHSCSSSLGSACLQGSGDRPSAVCQSRSCQHRCCLGRSRQSVTSGAYPTVRQEGFGLVVVLGNQPGIASARRGPCAPIRREHLIG